MAKSYLDIQNSAYKVGNIMDWTNALTRLSGVPVDITEVYDSFDKAVVYAATNPVAYEGQLITVTESGDTTVYVITPAVQGTHTIVEKVEDDNGDEVDTDVEYSIYIKKVGTVPTGDDASITVTEDGKVAIKGFADAEDTYLPRVKVTNGVKSIEWVPISQIVEGDTNTVTKVEVAEGSALSIDKVEDVNTDTVTYTLDVEIPEYAVTKTVGTGNVTYQITKDEANLGDAIVVPNAYDDSSLVQRVGDAESDISDIDGRLSDVEEIVEDHADRLEKIEAFFGTADHDGAEGTPVENLNDALDTLVEIQTFLNGEGGTVNQLLDAVGQNADDIKAIEDTLKTGGDFEKRVADVESKAAENAGDIDGLEALTGGFAEGETKGAIKLAIEDAAAKGQTGIDDAATAQAAAEAADGKAVQAQSDVDALEVVVYGEDGKGGVKATAENAASVASENAGRLDTAEGEIDVIQALVNHETKGNEKLRTDVDELLGIVKTGANANATLRADLKTVSGNLADLADVVEDEETGLAKTKDIADNAASEAGRANGRLDTAEGEIDTLQEIVDSGDGKTIRDDVTALQTLTGDASKGNTALYNEVVRVAGLVEHENTGLAKTKAIADDAASTASTNAGRLDVVEDILDGYTGKDDDTVKADVDAAKTAAGNAATAAGVADGKAVAAQNTADTVKAAVEHAETGLAKTKEIADNAASLASENAGRLDTAEEAIADLEEIVLDGNKGNAKLRDEVTALNTLTSDASKGNTALYNEVTRVAGLVDNASTGLAKTKEIADNAASTASTNSGRLDTVEGNYVRVGTDNKLYNGKDGDVIIFNCGSASVNV